MKNALTKVPIARVLFPFVIGIVIASLCKIPSLYVILTAVLFAIIYIAMQRIATPSARLTKSYIFNLPIIIICTCLGLLCHNINTPKSLPDIKYNLSTTAIAKIQKIEDNDFSTNSLIEVTQITDSCGKVYNTNHKMTAWIEGNNYSLKEGNIITFKFIPQEIQNYGNPEEHDYKKYMKNKGYLYHVYIKQNDYTIIGHHDDIFTSSRNIQRNLINLLLDSKLQPETKTFFITIILGDTYYLNKDIRENLSFSGIAHILALSGLHMGIIAFLLSLIFSPLDYMKMKKLRLLFILILSVVFVFITGLSHSAVRAAIMIGFVIIAKIIKRKNTSLNSLLFAALIILIFNPFAIYDIGFQFSFFSVILILLLSSKINLVSPKKELLYYFISLLVISAITSIGTAIPTSFYFNYISLSSIFSNMILIPILPIIIGYGILYLMFLSAGMDNLPMAKVSDSFYALIVNFSKDVNSYKFSYIDNIYMSHLSTVFLLCIILFLILFLYKHRVFYIYSAIILGCGTIISHYLDKSRQPVFGYVIFNDKQYTPILSFNKKHAQLIIPNDSIDIKMFRRTHRNFFAKNNITHIDIKNHSENIHTVLCNKRVAIIKDSSKKRLRTTPKIQTDIIIITNGYYGSIKDLLRNYNTELIVLSGNLYYKHQEKLYTECNEIGIKCHSISTQGAVYEYFQ